MNILIGENIKRLRKAKNITQEQLAEAMHVSPAAVSKWERSESYPDITALLPLAYYFEVSLDELMGYDQAKVEEEIADMFARYRKAYRSDYAESRRIITRAYADYPNDYRVMNAYMWNIVGDYADNDKEVLLAHKDEFAAICNRISEGCTHIGIRLNAVNMQGKLLWAQGRVDEALSLYRDSLPDWYITVGQKSEQLFAKDTPEFLYWVKRNMYELGDFTADKLCKSIFFDRTCSYTERISIIEHCGEELHKLYEETGEALFLVMARSLFGRMANDLKYRGGTPENVERIREKYLTVKKQAELLVESNASLKDIPRYW